MGYFYQTLSNVLRFCFLNDISGDFDSSFYGSDNLLFVNYDNMPYDDVSWAISIL